MKDASSLGSRARARLVSALETMEEKGTISKEDKALLDRLNVLSEKSDKARTTAATKTSYFATAALVDLPARSHYFCQTQGLHQNASNQFSASHSIIKQTRKLTAGITSAAPSNTIG